jgi:hypothetical protein
MFKHGVFTANKELTTGNTGNMKDSALPLDPRVPRG